MPPQNRMELLQRPEEDEDTEQETELETECSGVEDLWPTRRRATWNKTGLLFGLGLLAAGLSAHRWMVGVRSKRSLASSSSLADEVRLAAEAISSSEDRSGGVIKKDADALALKTEVEEMKSKIAALTKTLDKAEAEEPVHHHKGHAGVEKEAEDGGEEKHVPVHTFYMYRACDDQDWPMENVNTGNLAGVLWYLHNEVVNTVPRKFGITRVRRLKFQVAGTHALKEKNMTFGVRFAYDGQTCTGAGPWATPMECAARYKNYGQFVGCNNLGEYPFPTAAKGYP